mgnify:CR=1 FL=1
MPIYEYRCTACAHQEEFLQKLSDPQLTVCPKCGQATFSKMLTAAGFQLKGSGWYVTDFRGGHTSAGGETKTTPPTAGAGSEAAAGAEQKSSTESKAESSPAASESAAVKSAPATPAAPASTSSSDSH